MAGATLPAEGEPITTNDYSVDLYQGVVLSANRVNGLAGAFVAIADGVEGATVNPAATAARTAFSYGHFDYDVGLTFTFPGTINNTDFWNSGHNAQLPQSKSYDFLFFNLALQLQFGTWGFGISTDFQQYSLQRGESPELDLEKDRLLGRIVIGHLQLARAFADGQLLVGVGMRTTALSATKVGNTSIGGQELFSTVGSGVEAGFIWRPNDWPIRVGAAFHDGFTTRASDDQEMVLYPDDPLNRLYLPAHLTQPWDVNVGFAAQMGPRPLNPRWVDPAIVLAPMRRYLDWRAHERSRRVREAESAMPPHETPDERRARLRKLWAELAEEAALDESERSRVERNLDRTLRRRYAEQSRFFVLVTTSLMVTGTVENAVGIESMLERTVQRSGTTLSISPHLGVETEAFPHWLKLRGGTYLEPSRFPSNTKGARLHATFGLEQKLFPWDVFGTFPEEAEWRVSGAIDAARDYFGWSVAIGTWR